MRSRALFILLLGIFSLSLRCVAQPTIDTVAAVRALTNAEAMRRLPARFEATVTYYRDYDIDLFVQDGDAAIYVYAMPGLHLVPGDRVVVSGKTQDSFRPIVVAEKVTLLRHGALPKPVAATAEDLFSAKFDCRLGSVRGIIRSAQMVWSAGKRNIYGQVLIDGGYVDFAIASEEDAARARLVDAEVEITGVITSEFDQKMQQSGARFDVQSLSDVRILKPAPSSLSSLPVTPIEKVLENYHVRDLSQRTQVKGTITYYRPGRSVVLQSGSRSIWVITQTDMPLRIGDIAYASGFPDTRLGYVALDHGEVRDTGEWAPVTPAAVNWKEFGFGEHAFNLVSEEGELISQARQAAQDEYVLTAHGRIFSAVYRHPHGMDAQQLPPMKHVPEGAHVRVTGVSMFYSSDPFTGPVESDLLLRDFDDVTVVSGPPWVSKRNLEFLVAALAIVVLIVAGRGWQLEHHMARQSAAVAASHAREARIERERSRILEKINGTGPLDEILQMVAELASLQLGGAPCWCELDDGSRQGKYPSEAQASEAMREDLFAGGTITGFIAAALAGGAQCGAAEREVLVTSAHLASLAIETRRLYADLVHRTEFDLLTDVHNRFFFEKELDLHIRLAGSRGDSFGIIYLDLDNFKGINDSFGHRLGDIYLQEFALRIRRQLRGQDRFARVGGDEFAILVPLIQKDHDVEDIARRLQAALREPIVVEGHEFRALASFGIAIYPRDGKTRGALLDVADAAMYAAKANKRSPASETV